MSSHRVQWTNDESSISKRSASELGYYEDVAIRYFTGSGKPPKRTPLINRGEWRLDSTRFERSQLSVLTPTSLSHPPAGYFARVHVVRKALADVARELRRLQVSTFQIVTLGCGYDTTFFQLLETGVLDGLRVRYCEVDFPDLIDRKAAMIDQIKHFQSQLREKGYSMSIAKGAVEGSTGGKDEGKSGLESAGPSGSYVLLGQDVRNLDAFEESLETKCGLLTTLPTVLLSECTLNYMKAKDVHAILNWIPATFHGRPPYLCSLSVASPTDSFLHLCVSDSVLLFYDYVRPFDGFGETMLREMKERGSPLRAIKDFPTCAEIESQYTRHCYASSRALTLADIYYGHLSEDQINGVEERELFDEFEDWHATLSHYSFSWAIASGDGAMAKMKAVLPHKRLSVPRGELGPAQHRIRVRRLGGTRSLPGRWGQGACVVGADKALYIFGGFGKGLRSQERLNDTAIFDLETLSAPVRHFVPSGMDPAVQKLLKRMYHSAAPVEGGGMICFGGRSGPNKGYNDVIRIAMAAEDDSAAVSYSLPACEGEVPCGRWRHTMTKLGRSNCYLILGGTDGKRALGDVLIMEYKRGEEACVWKKVNLPDFSGRFGHSVDLIRSKEAEGEHTLVVYGGNDGRTTVFGQVVQLTVSIPRLEVAAEVLSRGLGPDPRYSHASFVRRGSLFVVGGSNLRSGEEGEAFAFHLDQRTWSAVPIDGDAEGVVWTRQQILAIPAKDEEEEKEIPFVLVGGGMLCFSFGSRFNPLACLLTLESNQV